MGRWTSCLTIVGGLLVAGQAEAHFAMYYPLSRSNLPEGSTGISSDDIDTAPCGKSGSTRSNIVSVFRPGQTITVKWEAFVQHTEPGIFRIAFAESGQNFPSLEDANAASESPLLFMDKIQRAGEYVLQEQQITLPNVECTGCTLQMVQYLSATPPYGAYYQCADITLSATLPVTGDDGPMVPPAGQGNTGNDGNNASGGSTSAAGGSTANPGSGDGAGDKGGGCQIAGSQRGSGVLALLVAAAAGVFGRRRAGASERRGVRSRRRSLH